MAIDMSAYRITYLDKGVQKNVSFSLTNSCASWITAIFNLIICKSNLGVNFKNGTIYIGAVTRGDITCAFVLTDNKVGM